MSYVTTILKNGYNVTVEVLTPDVPYIGTNMNWWVNGVDTGIKAQGNGILEVSLISTSGLIKTYRIEFTNETHFDYDVIDGYNGIDGVGIVSVTKYATDDLVDTYQILYTDGSLSYFEVTNGRIGSDGIGIEDIVKTNTIGLVDTYTITYTNGSTSFFYVTNGTVGESPELRMQNNKLQWKLPSGTIWTDLFDFSGYMWQKGTEAQRLSVVTPTVGSLYYQTDKALGLYEYKGGAWHFNGERLTKEVSSTTYTLLSEDRGYNLVFTNALGCTITVPNTVFASAIEIYALQKGAFMTFVAGSGITINKPIVFSQSGIGVDAMVGLRFSSASVCNLFGNLNLA